jgi:hypothetical protein
MKRLQWVGICILCAGASCLTALAQPPVEGQNPAAAIGADPEATYKPATVVLEWTPPAFEQLSAQASSRSSFTLDRTMLAAASSLLPEADPAARQAIGKLEGVSVRLLRFGPAGAADPAQVEALREAYHQRGWKHLVSTSDAEGSRNAEGARNTEGSRHNGANRRTDLWLTLEGVNVRGAVLLAETPRSLVLVTLKGDLSPIDLLHLRGHFGIPRFEADGFSAAGDW